MEDYYLCDCLALACWWFWRKVQRKQSKNARNNDERGSVCERKVEEESWEGIWWREKRSGEGKQHTLKTRRWMTGCVFAWDRWFPDVAWGKPTLVHGLHHDPGAAKILLHELQVHASNWSFLSAHYWSKQLPENPFGPVCFHQWSQIKSYILKSGDLTSGGLTSGTSSHPDFTKIMQAADLTSESECLTFLGCVSFISVSHRAAGDGSHIKLFILNHVTDMFSPEEECVTARPCYYSIS